MLRLLWKWRQNRTRDRTFLSLLSGDYTSHIPSHILCSRCHFRDEKGEGQKSSRHNTELSKGRFKPVGEGNEILVDWTLKISGNGVSQKNQNIINEQF